MRKTFLQIVGLFALVAICGCASAPPTSGGGGAAKKPRVAFVTNCVDPFWTIAEKGCFDAAEKFDASVDVKMPQSGDAAGQKQIVEDLLVRGIEGLAITPKDPKNQKELLNSVAAKTNLITHDSDAPESKRLVYIGMDNYSAGRMCGQMVKEALPSGGKIIIFVGSIDQLNGRQRAQGTVDEILGRPSDANRADASYKDLKAGNYHILDVRTDNLSPDTAKAQAEDSLVAHPDIDCMIGLFAYNAPRCLEAVKKVNKIGKIKLIGFDEDASTLQGIVDGSIVGTVVQDPYRYGYESVRILAALARGDKSVLPANSQFFDIPARKITKDNVKDFWDTLKKLTATKK